MKPTPTPDMIRPGTRYGLAASVFRLAGLRTLSEDLGRQSVTIEANANDEGHLYGSVGPQDIANALKRNKFNITQDQVRLTGPLKELGRR